MAKKEKKISINTLENVMVERFPEMVVEEWYGVEVSIKRTLPLKEMLVFVDEVYKSCFLSDGTYVPEILDVAIRTAVLTHFANFNLPESLEKQYYLAVHTDAYEFVISHINDSQFTGIQNAINRKIKDALDSDKHALRAKINDLVSAFERMSEQTESMFSGVGSEDIKTIIKAVGNNGVISEEKIVEAYIAQLNPSAE